MNKFGLISLSVLGTLGISAGSVAILNNAPGTKNKLNISFGDNVLVGQEANKDTVVKDETDNKDETNNLVAVTYMLDGVPTTILQEKGGLVGQVAHIEQILMGRRQCLLGWTKTPGKIDVVYKTDKDITLYPILYQLTDVNSIFNCFSLSFNESRLPIFDVSSCQINIPCVMDDWAFDIYNSANEKLTFNPIGYVDVADIEAGFVSEFSLEKEYLLTFYCSELDKVVFVTECQSIIDEFVYGDNLKTKDEAIFNVKYTSDEKEGGKPDSLSSLCSVLSMSSSQDFNGETYYLKGFSTAINSTELVSFGDMDPETTYYAVYAKADDFYSSAVRLYSIQELETNVEG